MQSLSLKFQQRRKFLLIAPAIGLPGLFLIFYTLGGGQGPSKKSAPANSILGFNTELPKAQFDRKDATRNKLEFYQKADEDSLRKKEYRQRDPYRRDTITASVPPLPGNSNTPDELLRRLDQLKTGIRHPVATPAPMPSYLPAQWQQLSRHIRPADTPAADPQLEKLNTMLDKVLKIQHPATPTPASTVADELIAIDSSNALPAVVQDNETLTTGATIALRLTRDALLNGTNIPKGQMVYGVVSINGDRMQISIGSIRSGYNIYNTALQVYDMDGLPGIHIPGMITRDVAKQSADQGISGLNLLPVDPSLAAQAASAGIQTAKSLFSRKVRMVRVSIRVGYQVLLRNTRSSSHTQPVSPKHADSSAGAAPLPPPTFPGGDGLRSFRSEGMELVLQAICLHDSLLWFALEVHNHSPIAYIPDYIRWFIRDRRQFRRTASQDIPIGPTFDPGLTTIPGYDTCQTWTGFLPFALARDKELVLQVGEKHNGRLLTLVVGHKEILNAKKL